MAKTIDLFDDYIDAFGVLLESCQKLGPKDELVVIFDESLRIFQADFFKETTNRGLSVTYIYLPRDQQLHLSDRGGQNRPLPSGFLTSISAATALITFLSKDRDTLTARRLIIRQPRPGNCRLAHIPGLSEHVLQILAVSIKNYRSFATPSTSQYFSLNDTFRLGQMGATDILKQPLDPCNLKRKIEATLALDGESMIFGYSE